ncbi:conserved exported hypothetical protein [Candidatus Methylobacter favarea]|uniref:Uncharacterized protein n=1 Tax=Candidatus Methylobacter favarea TaxID=2707345 RepID=A0A8S0Y9I9_9GAMM|nr:hypothetical protein [Candidatus Methylobacter favarea]CAA9890228.1 conserved exported hypothetical protein [Candidatus Methylobacter favarea]
MNTIKKILAASFLMLSLSAITHTNFVAVAQAAAPQPINATITHLEAALEAVNASDLGTAQEHMKAARQSAKDIIGGSLEVKTQRGTNAITNARRQAQKGDAEGASASLKQALDIFKSLHSSSATGSRGGLK